MTCHAHSHVKEVYLKWRSLHGKLDGIMDCVEVLYVSVKFCSAMDTDHEDIINESEP